MAWTWSNASLLFRGSTCWIEIGETTAFGAGRLVDYRIDQGRSPGGDCLLQGGRQGGGGGGVVAFAAERLDHLVVAGVLHEHRGRHIRASRGVEVGAAVHTVVVEHNGHHG